MLGVSRRTIRRYTKDFKEFLSEGANNPRRKSFTDDDVYILQTIRDLYARRLSPDEIRTRLGVEGVPQDTPGSALSLVPAIVDRFKQIEVVGQRTEEQLGELSGQVDDLQKQQAEYQDALDVQKRQLRFTQILGVILVLIVLAGLFFLLMQTQP